MNIMICFFLLQLSNMKLDLKNQASTLKSVMYSTNACHMIVETNLFPRTPLQQHVGHFSCWLNT